MHRNISSTEEKIDIKEMASRFSTDVIGCCAFGLEFNTLKDPESEFRKIARKLMENSFFAMVVAVLRNVCPSLIRRFRVTIFPPELQPFFFDLLRKSEEIRKNEIKRRDDFVQLMLDIRDQELVDFEEKGEEGSIFFLHFFKICIL